MGESARTERVTGTIYFKHKNLTKPIITPEDTVVAAAQQLTRALQGNVPGSNQQIEALTTLLANKEKDKRPKQPKREEKK